jgi:hypothetical protein
MKSPKLYSSRLLLDISLPEYSFAAMCRHASE